jgi:hypothetical protein
MRGRPVLGPPGFIQLAETAKEVKDEVGVRDVVLKVVQAKIAKTALRLYHAEQADRALCELRERIRAREADLIKEKRKTQPRQYRPKVCLGCARVQACMAR